MRDDPLNRMKCKKGSELPHSKMNEKLVKKIRGVVAERQRLRVVLSAMTNKALAERYQVHVRTIDRITAGENWSHVDD
jgi:hypothetical protein